MNHSFIISTLSNASNAIEELAILRALHKVYGKGAVGYVSKKAGITKRIGLKLATKSISEISASLRGFPIAIWRYEDNANM